MLTTRDAPQEDSRRHTGPHSEGVKKDIPCKRKPKNGRRGYIYIRQIYFKSKPVTRDYEGHDIMIKSLIH